MVSELLQPDEQQLSALRAAGTDGEGVTPAICRGPDFASFGRIAPDPVALLPVGVATLRQSDCATVVGFIPPDRVEDKLAVVGAAVFEGLAVDEIVRQALHELGREGVERFWELLVRQPVLLQRTSDPGQICAGLAEGALLGDSAQTAGQQS